MAGTKFDCNKSHILDPAKKITRIETIINIYENGIIEINFYHLQQRLVAVGATDWYVNEFGGRREVFSIGEDEQLIGCELTNTVKNGKDHFCGVTWMKMKVRV